jgi:hypothetical protein
VNRPAVRLVVERDIAGDDRHAQRLAGERHPLYCLGQLPRDLGLLGIAEVEAIGEADGLAAGARDVARSLEHREGASGARLETRLPALAVERNREPAVAGAQPQHGRVEAGPTHCPRADEMVVAPVDRRAAADVRRAEQLEQRGRQRRRVDRAK